MRPNRHYERFDHTSFLLLHHPASWIRMSCKRIFVWSNDADLKVTYVLWLGQEFHQNVSDLVVRVSTSSSVNQNLFMSMAFDEYTAFDFLQNRLYDSIGLCYVKIAGSDISVGQDYAGIFRIICKLTFIATLYFCKSWSMRVFPFLLPTLHK